MIHCKWLSIAVIFLQQSQGVEAVPQQHDLVPHVGADLGPIDPGEDVDE